MKLLGLAVLAMAVSPAWAQFGSAGAPPTMSGWSHGAGNFSRGLEPGRPFSAGRSNVIFLGEPWLDGYPSQSGPVTYIVLPPQASLTDAAKPAAERKPITPLLIEWHGDRFVRRGDDTGQPDSYAGATSKKILPVAKSAEPGPVMLIYRDGKREQVRDYSIIGGRLYTSADYIQSGSWMKTIRISALNLPATIEANHAAGVAFVLPSAPNVVVTHF